LKIDVYSGEDSDGEHLATFTVNGIDEIADSELLKKENVTRPRVSLSFELSRSGILLLNKAEAKVEETYYVDPPQNKTKKSKGGNETAAEANTTEANETEVEKPPKVQKKRSIPYSLNRIDKVTYGPASLNKEQIQKAKDRLRWFERRDEERARTDKAKNDFESIIYAMRSWISDYSDEHLPYIGSTDR
jgi:molecular chaperone DnaK (HSP70)